MMNDGNRAVGALGTGPSAAYTFMILFLFVGFLVWLTGNKMEYVITIFLLFSHIKFNKSLPNYLTLGSSEGPGRPDEET
jgi:hypothetical protein